MPIPSFYKTPKWEKQLLPVQDPLFPEVEADYANNRDFSPAELFQLFFDDELCELIVEQSVLYEHSKEETNFVVSQNEIKVLIGVLILSGLCPVSFRRPYWKNDSVCQNTATCEATTRNR